MNKYEWRELLSLAPADILLWAASGCLIGMKFINDPVKDSILAAAAVIMAIAACFIGMKNDERVSKLTNRLKKISYPVCLIVVILIIFLNFLKWNSV